VNLLDIGYLGDETAAQGKLHFIISHVTHPFFFFFFFFEFEVYCPLFTQQDIAVLREHYIGNPGSI